MQILRSSIPGCFIGFIYDMAEGLLLSVHCNHQIVWCVFADQLQYSGKESIYCRDVVTLGVLHRILEKPVVGAIDQAVAVYDIEFLPVAENRRILLFLFLLGGHREWSILCLLLQLLLIKILTGK